MNALIAWFARNPVAANMLMLGILATGFLFIPQTPREILPNIQRDSITITARLPGAAPGQIESSLCTPIEQSLAGISHSKQIHAIAAHNSCTVIMDLQYNSDTNQALDQVENRLRHLELPEAAGRLQVRQSETDIMLARLSIVGVADYRLLRQTAEKVRDDLIARGLDKTILRDALDYHIYAETPQENLRRFQLGFAEVAGAVNRNAGSIAAGNISGEQSTAPVVVSGRYKTLDDIANAVIRSYPDGGRIVLADLATLHDGFADSSMESRINGKPAVSVSVYQGRDTHVEDMARTIRNYVRNADMPDGVKLLLVQDNSSFFSNRMRILRDNAVAGLVLVFATLLLFLRLRLAFWVTAGIPLAFLGGFIALYLSGYSINMVSTFGLLLVLGIVVDDAIIIGENIHRRQQNGLPGVDGAIAGATELAKPVVFAVLTTAITFAPMFFLPGAEGRIAAQIPLIVIATLLFSLLECLLILPAHLSHKTPQRAAGEVQGTGLMNRLDRFIHDHYRPLLQKALHWRYACATGFACLFLLSCSLLLSEWVNVRFELSAEAEVATGKVVFAPGSSTQLTRQAVRQMEQAALALQQELAEQYRQPQIVTVRSIVGDNANTGYVFISLAAPRHRHISSERLMQRWREKTGPISKAMVLDFSARLEHDNSLFTVQLQGDNGDALKNAAAALKQHLQSYDGVLDIHDNFMNAHRQVQVQLNDNGRALGLDSQTLSAQIRAALNGIALTPLEKNGHPVAVTLRLPENERNSLWHLENLPIRLQDGSLVPLFALATLQFHNSPDSIRHINGRRVAAVHARVDDRVISKNRLGRLVEKNFLDTVDQRFAGIDTARVTANHNREQLQQRLWLGFGVAMIVMFVLMASLFSSYFQPLLVLSAVPFGMIGALLGHLLLNIELTWLSLTGIVAVSGIVVNDNMVLVFYINEKIRQGKSLAEAVTNAGVVRFRPIMLTTITTFFGLVPMLLEQSMEAQFLIPMAVSISFGVLFATLISLFLVPSLYIISNDIKKTLKLNHTPA